MAEVVLWLVVAMLGLGIWRQFAILGSRGQIFDALGLLPQWKFFAQSALSAGGELLDDYHLLVRLSGGDGKPQAWQEIASADERRWSEIIWNPHLRARSEIQLRMMAVANSNAAGSTAQYQSSLAYLTLLRTCFDRVAPNEGQALQFAIVATTGRDGRAIAARFVSAWHIR